MSGFAVSGAAQVWPEEARLLLAALVENFHRHMRAIDGRHARCIVQTAHGLLQLGFVHALFQPLLKGALRVLAREPPTASWQSAAGRVSMEEAVLQEMTSLAVLARNFLQVAEVAHMPDVALATATVMGRLCSFSEDELVQLLRRTRSNGTEALFQLLGVCHASIPWQQWERLCSCSVQAVFTGAFVAPSASSAPWRTRGTTTSR